MKHMTKDWYKDRMNLSFPIKLEIIDRDKSNLNEIFLNQYKQTFCHMKNNLPKNHEESVFENIFNGYLENVKKFFDMETLNKVSDIRLLALGKVFKEEYTFIEEEIIKKDAIQAYNKIFNQIKDNIPNNIKDNLNLHDALITNILREKDKFTIELDCSNSLGNVKKIRFENYKILEEENNFVNGWWLYEEIYIKDNQYELHVLIDAPYEGSTKLGYFTIRAKNIVFYTQKNK